jgi:hypothetical protein
MYTFRELVSYHGGIVRMQVRQELEAVPWLAVCGASDRQINEVDRHCHVPTSNAAVRHLVPESK